LRALLLERRPSSRRPPSIPAREPASTARRRVAKRQSAAR
jgi:hypothetical protein